MRRDIARWLGNGKTIGVIETCPATGSVNVHSAMSPYFFFVMSFLRHHGEKQTC